MNSKFMIEMSEGRSVLKVVSYCNGKLLLCNKPVSQLTEAEQVEFLNLNNYG